MTTNLKSQQNSVNQKSDPSAYFFPLLTGDNDFTMLYTKYLHILHHLQAMKMTFLKLFFICTFKDPKLRKNGPIWRQIQKKVELRLFHRVSFFQVWFHNCLGTQIVNRPFVAGAVLQICFFFFFFFFF